LGKAKQTNIRGRNSKSKNKNKTKQKKKSNTSSTQSIAQSTLQYIAVKQSNTIMCNQYYCLNCIGLELCKPKKQQKTRNKKRPVVSGARKAMRPLR
jgi:hypothetical protein